MIHRGSQLTPPDVQTDQYLSDRKNKWLLQTVYKRNLQSITGGDRGNYHYRVSLLKPNSGKVQNCFSYILRLL